MDGHGQTIVFIISTSIKQVKGLELILSVPFALEAVAVNSRCAVKGALRAGETDNLGFKNKTNPEIAGKLRVDKSTVWYILRKKKCTGELNNIKTWTSSEDNSRG